MDRKMADTYREEVIKPGDAASKLAKRINRESYGNSHAIHVIDNLGGFRHPVGFVWPRHILKEMYEQSPGSVSWQIAETPEGDGAGGKPQFFTLVGTRGVFFGLGWEPITMNADDHARSGRFPVAMISNEINVKRATKENFHLIEALFAGYANALSQARLVSLTGEFAVMKYSVTAFCDTNSDQQLVLTWGATCHGLMRRDMLINNAQIKPGMPIVGFWEPGYRCNGGSRLTQILLDTHDQDPRKVMADPKALEFVQQLTIPSKSYAWSMNRIQGWMPDGSCQSPLAKMVGAAHITGGGLWGKFGEILPEGVGAKLDNMPIPCNALLEAQILASTTASPLSDWEAYDTFHGGCGMLVVCPDYYHADAMVAETRSDGILSSVVGETIQSNTREVKIRSRFEDGKWLSSHLPE